MAHEINALDTQVGLAMAWHGKTIVVPQVTKELAFPHEIKRIPLYTNSPRLAKVPGYEVFMSADGHVIGKPQADTYHALTNSEFFGACTDVLTGTGAIIESAGTIKDRTRRFLTIKLDDSSIEIGGRKFLNRISFVDSIDGSTKFYAANTSICVVCANTARAVMGDKSGQFNFEIRHTKNLPAKVVGMEKSIDTLVGVQAQFNAALSAASSEPATETDTRNLLAGWISGEKNEVATRSKNTIDRLVALYKKGAGNRGETLLDVFSAVTDYYSHESSGGESNAGFRDKQWLSSEFADGLDSKIDFSNTIFESRKGKFIQINRTVIKSLQDKGQSLLATN